MFSKDKIKKAKKGNDRVFQELIEEEKNKLYRIAYLYVKNEDDALDIVQETVYKAYISIKNLKNINYFSTWITRILINSALDFIKKKSRIIPIDEFSHLPNIEEHEHEMEDSIDLVEAIERLNEPYKTVIILRYYKDFTIFKVKKKLVLR